MHYICRAKGLGRCWTGLITREALAELDAECGHDAESEGNLRARVIQISGPPLKLSVS